MPNKAVFFDRDGTLIKNLPYSNNPKLVTLIPHSISTIKNLNDLGYLVFVVSNQSAVARGLCKVEDVENTNSFIQTLFLKNKSVITKFYFCPHHPGPLKVKNKYVVNCNCRKPLAGLLFEASREFSINLSSSFMIGDNDSDILAGKNAGCITILLKDSQQKISSIKANFEVSDLKQAFKIIQNQNELDFNE